MRALWHHPLGREILVILVIKIIAIGAIWWLFFRPPVNAVNTPIPSQIDALLLNPVANNTAHAQPLPAARSQP